MNMLVDLLADIKQSLATITYIILAGFSTHFYLHTHNNT